MKDNLVIIQPKKYDDLFSTYHYRKTNSSLKSNLPKMPPIYPKITSLNDSNCSSTLTNYCTVQNRTTFSYAHKKTSAKKKHYSRIKYPLLTFFNEENQNSKNYLPYPSISTNYKQLRDFRTNKPKKYSSNKNSFLKMIYLKLFKDEPQNQNMYGIDSLFNNSNNSIIQNEENINKNIETDFDVKLINNYYINSESNFDNDKVKEEFYMLNSIPNNVIDSCAKELANEKNINEENNSQKKMYVNNIFFKLVLDSVKHKIQLQNEHNKEISVIWVKNLLDSEIELMKKKLNLFQKKQIEINNSINSSKFNINNSSSHRSISELSKVFKEIKTDRKYDFELDTDLKFYDLYSMEKNKQLMLLYSNHRKDNNKSKENKKLLKRFIKINNANKDEIITPYITQRISNSFRLNSRNNNKMIYQYSEGNNFNHFDVSQVYKNRAIFGKINFSKQTWGKESKSQQKATDIINEISSNIEHTYIEKKNKIKMVKSIENLNDYDKKRMVSKETSTDDNYQNNSKLNNFSYDKKKIKRSKNLIKNKKKSRNFKTSNDIKKLNNENSDESENTIHEYIKRNGKKLNDEKEKNNGKLNGENNNEEQKGNSDIINGIQKKYGKNSNKENKFNDVNEISIEAKKNKRKKKSKNELKNKSKTNNSKENFHQSPLKDKKSSNNNLNKNQNGSKKNIDSNISLDKSSNIEFSDEENEFTDEEEDEYSELDDSIYHSSDNNSSFDENGERKPKSKINKKRNFNKNKKKRSNNNDDEKNKYLGDINNINKNSKKQLVNLNSGAQMSRQYLNKLIMKAKSEMEEKKENNENQENVENKVVDEQDENEKMEIINEINEMEEGISMDQRDYLIKEMLEMHNLYKIKDKSPEDKEEIITKRKNMNPIVEQYFIYLMKEKFAKENFNKDVYREKFVKLKRIRVYRVFTQIHLKKLEQKYIYPILEKNKEKEKEKKKEIEKQKKELQMQKAKEEMQKEVDKIYSKAKKKKNKKKQKKLIYDSSYLFKKLEPDNVNIKKEIQDIINTDYGQSFFFKKTEEPIKHTYKKKKRDSMDLRQNALFREMISKDKLTEDELERLRRKQMEMEELKRKQELRDKRLYDFFARIQKLKDGKLDNFEEELNNLIDEQLDNSDKDKIQMEMRLNSFMRNFQLNRVKEKFYSDFKHKRIGFISPIIFKSDSFNNINK